MHWRNFRIVFCNYLFGNYSNRRFFIHTNPNLACDGRQIRSPDYPGIFIFTNILSLQLSHKEANLFTTEGYVRCALCFVSFECDMMSIGDPSSILRFKKKNASRGSIQHSPIQSAILRIKIYFTLEQKTTPPLRGCKVLA